MYILMTSNVVTSSSLVPRLHSPAFLATCRKAGCEKSWGVEPGNEANLFYCSHKMLAKGCPQYRGSMHCTCKWTLRELRASSLLYFPIFSCMHMDSQCLQNIKYLHNTTLNNLFCRSVYTGCSPKRFWKILVLPVTSLPLPPTFKEHWSGDISHHSTNGRSSKPWIKRCLSFT